MLWEGTWKALAMWKASRNNELAWFICIFVFNTIGILSIIYILWDRNNVHQSIEVPKKILF
jgi:hypothetical protein